MKNTIVYDSQGKTYVNLTNKCSNCCEFCIRNTRDGIDDYYLWLTKEPTAEKVIKELEKKELTEVVFCGFGEPLYALDVMLETAKYIKDIGVKTRLNTNGQASLIAGKDVAKRLKGLIDTVSISLNASTAEKYDKICNCCFGDEGFKSMLDFASDCKNEGIRIILSVVDCIGEAEIEACRKIAEEKGVEYKVRKQIL